MLLSVGDRIILLFYLFGKGVCFFILLDEEHIEDSEQSYTAKISPTTFRFPVKAFPNWFTISAITYAKPH